MSPSRLALVAVLLLAALTTRAQDGAREDLREALGDYYVHVVSDRLALSDEQAGELRPQLIALADTQREARSATRGVQRRLAQATRSQTPDAARLAALLEEFLDTEADAHEQLRRARGDLVAALEPAQQAAFLLSEDEYRQAVMRHLQELRGKQRGRRPEGRAGSPWRRERAEGDGGRGAGPSPRRPSEEQLRDQRENLTLLLAFQLRNQGQVPLARVVDLLPQIELNVGAQLELAHAERIARGELQEALESGAKSGVLEARVAALLQGRATFSRRLRDSRRAIVDELEPLQAARFVQLQEGFRRTGPRRLRMMHELMTEGDGQARDRGPRRKGQR